MQTEYLEEFLVLADELNFRKAADRLHISHPALSKHVAALEQEIGFTLFDRAGATKLTPEGEQFLLCAQRTLNVLADGIAQCLDIKHKNAAVRVQWSGIESSFFESVLLALTTPFVAVKLDRTRSSLDALTENQVDVVFCYQEQEKELGDLLDPHKFSCLHIGKERCAFATSRRNPLISGENLGRGQLDQSEVLFPSGSLYDDATATIEHAMGQNLRFIRDASISNHHDVLFRNLDYQLHPGFQEDIHALCAKRSDLIEIDEVAGRAIIVDEYLVYRADDPNPNVRAFIEEVGGLTSKNGLQA